MPIADQNYTFYTIPLPHAYRRLSRRSRLAIELSAGLAALALISIGASMQTPVWLQIAGWAWIVLNLSVWSILVVKRWRQRQIRDQNRAGGAFRH